MSDNVKANCKQIRQYLHVWNPTAKIQESSERPLCRHRHLSNMV